MGPQLGYSEEPQSYINAIITFGIGDLVAEIHRGEPEGRGDGGLDETHHQHESSTADGD